MVVPSLSQASHAFYRYWAAAVGSCMLEVGVPWGVQGAQVATGQREKSTCIMTPLYGFRWS